eukprot:CAMPEP_0174345590 /NCGR_PEP_ID=MMETSP0811_2-20130205/1102_1 /TAXON_ID=73025 ORGANISM="Eutreptiella gymnastica-like, Strain CCMP1594" /NCGR_SAMPLE_ID=MMETSP0811_2 /ASSEMBLY_ACC=CAM_ASM_000667 /LENGTH=58 /DNA_ID=CAMNT_0015469445 /DNA_START=21 /DNA_END=194 /DNA_ORIENTATION=+
MPAKAYTAFTRSAEVPTPTNHPSTPKRRRPKTPPPRSPPVPVPQGLEETAAEDTVARP